MFALALLSVGAPTADLIGALPGWSKELPSKMYSGYVNVTSADRPMLVHYWYLESEAQPEVDPTILWSNGGPGARLTKTKMTPDGIEPPTFSTPMGEPMLG